tara:strand:+ start:206 stop:361 length:156 start_codon:yes stop_codon:yes gene_type:complete
MQLCDKTGMAESALVVHSKAKDQEAKAKAQGSKADKQETVRMRKGNKEWQH